MTYRKPLVVLLTSLATVGAMAIAACTPTEVPPDQIEGYAPVYDTSTNSAGVRAAAPRAIVSGGKIYTKDSLLYQVENGRGIHIISIANPAQPQKLGFLEISGCQELSILGSMLYTNNVNDLIVVDIADRQNPVLKSRIPNTFHLVNQGNPPATGWFECVDAGRGTVIGWELKTLYTPQCLSK